MSSADKNNYLIKVNYMSGWLDVHKQSTLGNKTYKRKKPNRVKVRVILVAVRIVFLFEVVLW